MGTSFTTEVPQMQQTAVRVNDISEALQRDLTNLDAKIQNVVNGWQGAGSKSYLDLQAAWGVKQRKLREVLAEVSAGIKNNAVAFQRDEDDVVAVMQRSTQNLV